MIEFNLGVPGSGKTYKGVYALYSNFGINKAIRDKEFVFNDVKIAYTNVNEIKIECFEPGSVFPLDWDKFKDDLTILHNLYKNKVTDSVLIDKAKELNLFECLIVLDECHNMLDKNDVVLVWWLSYHRHLHHQIYLITQNLGLVFSKYKSFSEFFYVAKASSLKLFKNKMVYNEFVSSRLSLVSKTGSKKIPFVKEIFDTYHSGANQQSKNLILKFILIAISFFILLAGFIYYFISSKQVEQVEQAQQVEQVEQVEQFKNYNQYNSVPVQDNKEDDLTLFKFSCFKTLCLYQFEDKTTIEIPQNILKSFLVNIEPDRKYLDTKDKRLIVYVLINQNKLKFLTKRTEKNENKNNEAGTNFLNIN